MVPTLESDLGVSSRVRTVCLVLAEASRQRAAQLGGEVVRITKYRDGKCTRCGQDLYAGQVLVRTWWRPVTMGQARWAGGHGRFPVYECGACSLEKVLSRRALPASEQEVVRA